MEIVEKICESVISSLYQYTIASLVMSFLIIMVYKRVKENSLRSILIEVWHDFHTSKEMRIVFFFSFYVCMILFRTVLCRQIWGNPIGNVLGAWSLKYDDGSIRTEPLENILLFIPFAFLYLLMKINKNQETVIVSFQLCLYMAVKASLMFSVGIEVCQIIFRVGTFQLSDVFNNSFGGMLGGIIFWVALKLYYNRK